MSETAKHSSAPLSPDFWWWRMWGPPPSSAGQPPAAVTSHAFNQPILPGWTFAQSVVVDQRNSRSPETEREIVAEQSYGRQLGRLTDAVAALIQERAENAPQRPAFEALLELRDAIEQIKARSSASRLRRIESDLQRLQREQPGEFQRLAARIARQAKADESGARLVE